jgi:hypothetical protein
MKALDIEARGNAAMKYLHETDESVADLKHDADMAEAKYEAIVDALMLHSDAKSADMRKAEARTHATAEAAKLAQLDAERKHGAVVNRRKTEGLAVEWCRSLYSNYKQGAS